MSPKTKAQYEEIRRRSMAVIKEAALELFAHSGYHSTSISQISREAGISKGLIYNYFSGKEDLLHAIIMDVVELGDQLIGEHLESTIDPYEQLRLITVASFDMIKNNLHYWKFLTSLAFQTEALAGEEDLLKRKQEEMFALFIHIFQQMGYQDPKGEAYFYAAAMDGIMIHYMQMEDSYPLAEMQTVILERYGKRPA